MEVIPDLRRICRIRRDVPSPICSPPLPPVLWLRRADGVISWAAPEEDMMTCIVAFICVGFVGLGGKGFSVCVRMDVRKS